MPRWGHLDIGENIGDAKSYDPMPIVQQYAQNLAQNKAKHEAEVKQLGDELAKGYDPNGLRNDADKAAYLKQYGGIRDAAIEAENEKDPTKKALALSGVRQKLNGLSAWAEGSKNYGKNIEQQAIKLHAEQPYAVDDDTFNKLMQGKDMAYDDPNIPIKGWQDIVRGVNPNDVIKSYKTFKTDFSKQHPATFDNGTLVGKTPWGQPLAVQKRVIPMDGDNNAFESALHWASQDKNAQKLFHDVYTPDKYPQLQNPDPQVELALKTRQFMHDQGDGNGFVETKEVKGPEPKSTQLTPGEKLSAYHWNLEHNPDGSPKYGVGGQNATAIIAENMRNSNNLDQFVPLIKNMLPKDQYAKGQDIKPTIEVDPNTGQQVHVWKFPNKVSVDQSAVKNNRALKVYYNNKSNKHLPGDYIDGSGTLGFGKKLKPFEQSDTYKNGYLPEEKVIKDNSQPYKIPTGDPEAYDIGVATMLREQGASDAEIQKILGKSGVNPVKLGQQQPKTKKVTAAEAGIN